jgi:hypothetical protein
VPTITIADLNKAKQDVDHIAELSTSQALTATDRLGNTKDTLAGAMYKIGAFNDRGPWATAANYAIKDLVSNGGTWYVCVAPHVSGATFAGDSATKWRIYQGVLASDLSASNGSNLSGHTPSGTGALPTTVGDQLRKIQGWTINVQDAPFYAKGDGTTDDTLAIMGAVATIAALGGGALYIPWPTNRYRTTQPLNFAGVSIVYGDGNFKEGFTQFDLGGSCIFADHNGSAVVSLKGASHVTLKNLTLEARQSDAPKVGLALGRSTTASAGNHRFESVVIRGNYKVSGIYSIASEENEFDHVSVWLYGESTGFAAYYSAEEDTFSVDGLVTSTNISAHFYGCSFVNSAFDDGDPLRPPSVVYIDAKGQTGSISFFGGYLVPNQGSYITIRNAGAPDADILGPFNFDGVNGERLGVDGNPTFGLRILSDVPVALRGLKFVGSRFNFLAGADKKAMFVSPDVTLFNPLVVINPEEAFPYAVIDVPYGNIRGGIFSVGREGHWKAITLAGAWTNELGPPFQQAEYKVAPDGEVFLRGEVSGGSGLIFTLPVEARPKARLRLRALNSAGTCLITIETTGTVTLTSGANTSLDLSTIRFTRD